MEEAAEGGGRPGTERPPRAAPQDAEVGSGAEDGARATAGECGRWPPEGANAAQLIEWAERWGRVSMMLGSGR